MSRGDKVQVIINSLYGYLDEISKRAIEEEVSSIVLSDLDSVEFSLREIINEIEFGEQDQYLDDDMEAKTATLWEDMEGF